MTPCADWPFDETCCTLPDGVDQAIIDRAISLSTGILWVGSGRRYGPCEVTVRPCLMSCDGGSWSSCFPYRGSDGQWRNFCGCPGDCSCDSLCEIRLDGPVASIEEVGIGADTLLTTDYRLDKVGEGWRLLRTDGGCWPDCQTMTAETGEAGSFWVTYRKGVELDALALAAHGDLVCNIARACIPGCKCDLPKNMSSIVRQGVAIQFDTAVTWVRTLPLVAAFLDGSNPSGLTSASSVWSPDIPSVRRTQAPSS